MVLDQVVTRTQIDEGKLKFVPDADANGSGYATFGFKVSDGTDESASAYTMTIDVTAVNDPPTAADNTVTTAENNLAAIGGSVKFKLAIVCEKRNYGGDINDHGIRNRKAECRDLTLLGTRGGDTWGFSRNITIRDSALQKRTNARTGVETGTMTLRVGTEPDTIKDDGGAAYQNTQENFTVMLRLLHERDGGPPSFLKMTTSEYHWFTMGSIRLEGHLGDDCEYLADNLHSGCATPASEAAGGGAAHGGVPRHAGEPRQVERLHAAALVQRGRGGPCPRACATTRCRPPAARSRA